MRGYKHILLLLTLIFGVSIQGQQIKANNSRTEDGISVGSNTMYIEDIVCKPDTQIVIPVNMVNDTKITAFQFDLYLPEGVTIAEENGKLKIALTAERKTAQHLIRSSQLPNGGRRIIAYSSMNVPFNMNEGALVNITVNIAKTIEGGSHNIQMKNIRLVKLDASEIVTASRISILNIEKEDPNKPYTLTLEAVPADAGSFNIGAVTSHIKDVNLSLRAYTNTGFKFLGWEHNGIVISTEQSFVYSMPGHDVKLVARYEYNPDNPDEPDLPVIPVYSTLNLACTPAEAGYFNVSGGNKYEVGSTVALEAYNHSGFKFINWTENGEIVSTDTYFNYTMKAGNPTLVANYEYNPDDPDEPIEPKLYHKLTLNSNPGDGGYFNISSGNEYQANSTVYLYAYSNQWYIFQNWTIGDSIISTDSGFNYTMPDNDVALTANYIYNPDNPDDPDLPTLKNCIYGMTANGVRGQTIAYPVYLENTPSIRDANFAIQFPEGFKVDTQNIILAERAAEHIITINSTGNNSYQVSLIGNKPFDGTNGKLFDLFVTIPDTATMQRNYPIALTSGTVADTLNAQFAASLRNGHIYIEKANADGLYAKFTYEKLNARVKFSNLSAENAIEFLWNFGDGTTSTEVSPMHTYAQSGEYTVTLTATSPTSSDIAVTTIIVNDESTWKAGGTYYLTDREQGVRYFTTAESLMQFISATQSVTENICIKVDDDKKYTLPITDENLTRLGDTSSKITAAGATLTFTTTENNDTATVSLGNESDSITAELIEIFNTFAPFTTNEGVRIMLCSIDYAPGNIKEIHDQTVKSGTLTAIFKFTPIGKDLQYDWTLTTTPDTTAVRGYKTSGTGTIPAMLITNIDKNGVTLNYHITATYNGLTFCEFDKKITILPSDVFIYEDEWNILKAIDQQLRAGGWPTPWDMSGGIGTIGALHGLEIERGHVVGINLSMQEITAGFPTAALQLPELRTISFEHNRMGGEVALDILEGVTLLMETNPEFTSQLTEINLSHNNFRGNIGYLSLVSSILPNLETLKASHNRFSEINPKLQTTITTLDLRSQNTGEFVRFNIDEINSDKIETLSTVLRYNHTEQTYDKDVTLRISNYIPGTTTTSGAWGIELDATSGSLQVRGSNVYKGQSGDTLYLSYPAAAYEVENSYGKTVYNFVPGNANFLNEVDASDLQSTILYIFGEYNRPFNFTAADTYSDNNVNVQDVICTINILLAQEEEDNGSLIETATESSNTAIAYSDSETEAELIFEDGKIKLRTSTPVAAMSIKAAGDIKWNLDAMGLEQSTSKGNVVGYSLFGNTIPVGESIIGTYEGNININGVSLSDENADNITVTLKNGLLTSIAPTPQEDSNEIYTLRGERLNSTTKGIHIIKNNNKTYKVYNK